MSKLRNADLHLWVNQAPITSSGAKEFLRSRFGTGVRSGRGRVFCISENNDGPDRVDRDR